MGELDLAYLMVDIHAGALLYQHQHSRCGTGLVGAHSCGKILRGSYAFLIFALELRV
jgi:hypothetical protein